MTHREDQLNLLILDLLSPARSVAPDALINQDEAAQSALLKSIRDHRLAPMLRYMHHGYHAHVVLPDTLIAHLEQSHRKSAFRSLHIQQALHHLDSLLRQNGVPYVAMKGAFLAFHAYPNPALRPMRDIDILVPEPDALTIFNKLVDAGYILHNDNKGDAAAYLALSHQLPPLISPHGRISVELHHRIANPQADKTPFTIDSGFWARANRHIIGGRAISLESPTDLLRHLIHHAAYHHTFDNGPITVLDVAFLLSSSRIDWPIFWQMVLQDNMMRGTLLTLRLVQEYWPHAPITWQNSSLDFLDPDVLNQTRLLLFNDHDLRIDLKVKSSMSELSRRNKIAFVLKKLFPSPQNLSFIYGRPTGTMEQFGHYLANFKRVISTRAFKIGYSSDASQHAAQLSLQKVKTWLYANQ